MITHLLLLLCGACGGARFRRRLKLLWRSGLGRLVGLFVVVLAAAAQTVDTRAELPDVSPAISETTSKVEQSASYDESEEEVIVTLPATQQQQSQPMMRSKSRVVMVGGDSVDRYYRSQLLGSLYKRG